MYYETWRQEWFFDVAFRANAIVYGTTDDQEHKAEMTMSLQFLGSALLQMENLFKESAPFVEHLCKFFAEANFDREDNVDWLAEFEKSASEPLDRMHLDLVQEYFQSVEFKSYKECVYKDFVLSFASYMHLCQEESIDTLVFKRVRNKRRQPFVLTDNVITKRRVPATTRSMK